MLYHTDIMASAAPYTVCATASCAASPPSPAAKEITSKQFGDACEMHVIAELMFAGRPAVKMPDGWPGYDIIAETDDGPTRISVKGMRFDGRRSNRSQAGWWVFKPDSKWDWLALVYLDVDDGTRQSYLVPRRWALANSFDRPDGQRGLYRRNNAQLARFANNFALSDDPPERASADANNTERAREPS